MFNLRSTVQDIFQFIHNLVCFFQRASRRSTYVHHDNALVFLRYESRLGGAHQINQQNDSRNQRSPHHPAMMDKEHYTVLIFTQHGIERSIISCTYPSVDTRCTLRSIRRTHHNGTQSRTKGQRRNHGDTYRSSHRDTELCIEHTRRSAHKCYWDKHCHKYAGTGNDSHRHIAHRIFRSEIRRLISGIELRLHRLDHHNGIIHHCSDGKYQGKQGQDIQTESGSHKAGKCSDQRHYNRNRRDKRTLQVLQEEVHHQDNQDDSNNKRLHHIMYGSE